MLAQHPIDVMLLVGVVRRPGQKRDRAAPVQGREAGLSRKGELDRGLGSSPEGADGPVTATVTRRVKPGHEPFYERFLDGIIAAAIEFAGHLSVEVFRPGAASSGEYRVVYRFDTREHLQAWLDSDERAAWLERAEPHVSGPMGTQVLTGLETWFTLPSHPGIPPPPRYKMAILAWIAIFPLITLMVILLGPLLEGLSVIPRLAITTAVTVPIMTWLVMPRVTRLLRGWLYPGS
jgi:antibiotic biosynthesis monooxygenase (ABM) superfamily enzyme